MRKPGTASASMLFTIRCAGCDGDEGLHRTDCPSVLALGCDNGAAAATMAVYPRPGASFGHHDDAHGALRFYSIFGPVELHLENGTVVSSIDLPGPSR